MDELEENTPAATPVWAVFGDLMAALVGVFVLLLVWTLGMQVELESSLQEATQRHDAQVQRRKALERALAEPLASGRITIDEGRIGISGSVLFALNSDRLQPQGRRLLDKLVEPLRVYLRERDELLMVSGFTDSLAIQKGNPQYHDNWELSAQRALTVTRALIEAGMPRALVFAAAFGEQQPVASNQSEQGRARNRRVEIAPVPRAQKQGAPRE